MHITIFADPIDTQYAGIHHYTKNLTKNLLKTDLKNTYTIVHAKPNEWLTKAIQKANKKTQSSNRISEIIIPRNKFPGGESIRRFFTIPKIINKLSPNIVLEPCHIGPFRLKKGIKRALVVHDITPVLFPHFHTFRGRFIHKLFLKRSIENADIIITPSQTTKEDIVKKYHPKAKISVTHLGVKPPEKTETDKNISQPYFLYLGTIEPRKNLEILVDAFIELKTTHQIPHQLILAGQIGWKSKQLLKKIKKYNNQSNQNNSTKSQQLQIITTDWITESEKEILLKNADIFIYPSLYEGFGLPPLEAMNYGIPVICSKGGSLKEIYRNTALLFNPTDKEKLKKHILSLINNSQTNQKNSLRDTLIKNGLSFAKKHTWQKTAEETLKAISY
ncbi:glycosyltransferase family 4 protein [Candidatus Gracilibacteria bacterium]|nr:glycosyltransferase family 4 protein [Candidatus Gracilibacteria bacterium]